MEPNPKEEQEGELEALEAIFGDDFTVLDEAHETSGARFQVDLVDDAADDVKIRIIFTHAVDYPQQALLLVVHALEGLSTPRRKDLQVYLEGVARDNMDMPAVYTVCEAARDWLAENVVGKVEDDKDEENANKFETLDSTQQDKVEVISSKAVGTPVTEESFSEWREKFFVELEALKTAEQLAREAVTKMTGREFFESKNVVVSVESESFWEAEASRMTPA